MGRPPAHVGPGRAMAGLRRGPVLRRGREAARTSRRLAPLSHLARGPAPPARTACPRPLAPHASGGRRQSRSGGARKRRSVTRSPPNGAEAGAPVPPHAPRPAPGAVRVRPARVAPEPSESRAAPASSRGASAAAEGGRRLGPGTSPSAGGVWNHFQYSSPI